MKTPKGGLTSTVLNRNTDVFLTAFLLCSTDQHTKTCRTTYNFFLIVIQSQALKKGELQVPEMRNPWNQDTCFMPGSRNSHFSTKRSGKLHLPTKEMDLCGSSRWHVCVCTCVCVPVYQCVHVCMCVPVLCSIQIKSPECLLCAVQPSVPSLCWTVCILGGTCSLLF